MTRPMPLLCAFTLVALVGCTEPQKPLANPNTPPARIGTYDSRSVAVGFVGSEVYQATAGKELTEKMAEYEKAKSQGNERRMKELQNWGQTRQDVLHRQGFSTAPVDNILAHIADQLPGIREQAGVSALVSKWDQETLAGHKSAQQVDVTMALVDAFKPNAKQRKSAIEIRKHDPVPLHKLKNHMH